MNRPYKPMPEWYEDEEVVLTLGVNSDNTFKEDIPEFNFVRVVEIDVSDHTNDKFDTRVEFVKTYMNQKNYEQALKLYEISAKEYREFLERKIIEKQVELELEKKNE